jgi:hypothetical protein
VNRHGPPVADLRVVSTVEKRHGSGEEDRVTAQQLWEHGPNAARGGSLAGDTDEFTLNDLRRLTRFIGHALDKNYSAVELRLRSQLTPLSAGRQQRAQPTTAVVVQRRCEDGCGEQTSRPDHPLCYRCYKRRKEDNTLWESADEDDEEEEEEEEEEEDDEEEEEQRRRGGRGTRFNARPSSGGRRYHPYGGVKRDTSERCEECGTKKRNGKDKPLCYNCWKGAQ